MAAEVPWHRFVLWLNLTPKLGSQGIEGLLRKIAQEGLSPEEFLAIPVEEKSRRYKLLPEAAAALSRGAAVIQSEYGPVEDRLRGHGVEWVTHADASYPQRIVQRLVTTPSILYFYGNRSLLDRETFAAFSSRGTSRQGFDRMERVVEKWVLKPSVLVGGHSTPSYQRAAVVPLRWGTPRIMVLDCGMFTALSDDLSTEPFKTARLWRYNFDPKTDLVISFCRPKDLPLGIHNKPRDWLISAIADDLLFIEVRTGGVMESIGLAALSQGRDVWVMEWPQYTDRLQGNVRLLTSGAIPLNEKE